MTLIHFGRATSQFAPATSTTALHPSLGRWNAVCVSVCLSATTIALFLRSYVRLHVKRQWLLEDYICCVAWIGLLAYCVLMTVTVSKHAGIHEHDLSLLDGQQAIRWFNTTSIVYNPAVLATKVAILLFYRRIFSPVHRGAFDIFLRSCMAIMSCFYFTTTIVKIWQCHPRARIWDKSIAGTCLSSSSILNTSGLFNLVTDVIILLVPVKAVWKMQMSTKRKVGVIAVFTLGLTAPIFSIVGTIARFDLSSKPDVTYHQPIIQLWAAAEVTTGLICVCVPTLAGLARNPRRSQIRKPSTSIINGLSNSVARRHASTRKLGSSDEVDLFDFSPQDNCPGGTQGVPMGVVTGIEGGVRDDERERQGRGQGAARDGTDFTSGDEGDQVSQMHGIMTSVKIEQSYV